MAEIWFQINEDRKTLREVPFGKTPPAITQKNDILPDPRGNVRVVLRIKEKDVASISSKEWKIGHYVLDSSVAETCKRLKGSN